VIILDTNVISELMRSEPHPAVFAWAAGQPRDQLHTTSITKAEILYGIAALPHGRRRSALATRADAMFVEDFADRVLPFDETTASFYAEIVVKRQRAGRPIETLDAQIAAIASMIGADVATRNVNDFADCGLTIINPWAA
jgi:predicted nucleic acid-binding protein